MEFSSPKPNHSYQMAEFFVLVLRRGLTLWPRLECSSTIAHYNLELLGSIDPPVSVS